MDDLPKPQRDLRHLDPDVRKERVKLGANGFSAVGLALLIGSLVAPVVDPARTFDGLRIASGILLGCGGLFAGQLMLRYMKAKEAA